MKTILSLYDFTGNWSKPYRDSGYNVVQLDLKLGFDCRLFPSQISNTSRLPKQFIDILSVGPVHGILAAPPCTYFSGSGAKYPRSDLDIIEGLSMVDVVFRLVWVTKPQWWVMENPVGKLRKWIGPPKMSFHPCDYGDPYTKRTLLWGDFNSNLIKSPVPPTDGSKLWRMYGGKSDRTKTHRSSTPLGFAYAFFNANP